MVTRVSKVDSWIYLWSHFKTGDDVFVLLDDDNYWWGKFTATYRCCIVGGQEFPWDKVVLISHDGFPVKFLKTGICPEWFDNRRAQLSDRIRNTLSNRDWERRRSRGYLCGGDPWLIEDVGIEAFNLSMGMDHEFLKLTHPSGTVGLLYDLDGVLEFG